MTPWEIAKPGTESAHQKALFAWAAMAERHGFKAAWDEECYRGNFGHKFLTSSAPELKWLFAIPNGGARNAITAGRMKAEGVKKGVADIFLPVTRRKESLIHENDVKLYGGLWVEMKKEKEKLSLEQENFKSFCHFQGYKFEVCYSWIEAAKAIETYLS